MSLHQSARSGPERLSREDFRSFQRERPDHERWELIDGRPVMMTPPLIAHNRIASNLERLLEDALAAHDLSRVPAQRPGVDLGLAKGALASIGLGEAYVPEPDVAVIESEPVAGRRVVDKAFLFAEVVSSSDDTPILRNERWIDIKGRIYREHIWCEAVLVIEQNQVELRLWLKDEQGWVQQILTDLENDLLLPGFGLVCKLGDLYAGTHLRRRPSRV